MKGPSRTSWLAIAAVVLALEIVVGLAGHRDDEALAETARSGTPEERVFALYVQSSRGDPQPLPPAAIRELLASEHALVREWVMTPNFRRVTRNAATQQAWLAGRPDTPETRRSRFFLERGAGDWLTLDELRSFLDARD